MKFMKILTFIICLLAYGDVLTAIEIGDKAPPLNIAKWIKGTPVSLDSKNDAGKKACVIFFWATWNNVSQNLMNFISRESYIFKKDGVDFVGYKIYLDYIKLRKSNIKRFIGRTKNNIYLYNKCKLDENNLESSICSFLGYAKHANAYLISKKLFNIYFDKWTYLLNKIYASDIK